MDKEETTRLPIGRILVDSGFLSAGDLNLALWEQSHTNELLGQVLVKMGVLEPADVKAVLSIQERLGRPEDAVTLAAGVRQMLGALLVKAGKITPAQMEDALVEQKRTGEKLGEVFIRRGLLTERQLNNLLAFQRYQVGAPKYPSPLRLGELLVSTGHITREQLDDALSKQSGSGKKIGEVLIEEGYAKPHHVRRCLRMQQMLLTSALAVVLSLGPIAAHGSTIAQTEASGATIEMQAPAVDLEPYLQTRSITLQVIHLPAGTYRISSTLQLPSNTVIEGEGDATIIRADASFNGSKVITNSDFANGNRNIFIRNLRMEVAAPQFSGYAPGILSFNNVEGLEIDNITMVNDSPMYGIDLSFQVSNATVQGCTLTNTSKVSGGGIMIRNGDPLSAKITSGIVVRNNRIASVSDEAISVFAWQGRLENVRIENNTIKAVGASFGIAAYGINSPEQGGQLRGVDIMGNSIEGGSVGGIGVMGGAEQVNVVNNSVKNTTTAGIFIHQGEAGLPPVSNVNVLQNAISDVGNHGIFVDGVDVQVRDNVITDCTGSGIYAAAGVSLVGNVITDAHPGILVEARSSATISDNVLNNSWEIVYLH
jgi:hypothetical protein